MNLAIICQPNDCLLPPHQSAVGEWSYQVAGRLTVDADVTIFGRKTTHQPASTIIEDSPFGRGKFRLRFILGLPAIVWAFIGWVWQLFSAETYPLGASSLYRLPYALQIAYELRRQQYAIAHVHSLLPFVSVIRWLNPSLQIVLHTHDGAFLEYDSERVQTHLDRCDRIFAPTDSMTKQIHDRFPQTRHYCQTLAHGVDVDRFRPIDPSERPTHKHMLYVGSLAADGLPDLLAAFPHVLRRFPATQFMLVCMPPCDKREIDAFLEGVSAEISDHLQLVNHLKPDQLSRMYQQAAVVVSASKHDVFNSSLMQAAACGIPTVAVETHSTRNIIDDKRTGFLVEAERVDMLTTRICDLLRHANVRRQMGAAARKRIARLFAWKKISRSVLHSYRSLLENERSTVATKTARTR